MVIGNLKEALKYDKVISTNRRVYTQLQKYRAQVVVDHYKGGSSVIRGDKEYVDSLKKLSLRYKE